MIKTLYIKNFAIIKELKIPFKKGLTVITGETGSGKSVILKALGISIGGKISKYMVRSGKEKSIIEASINKIKIRRLISITGRSKAYLNDQPISLNDLKNHTGLSIDFHGQNEQQLILNSEIHIDYLDKYCRNDDKVKLLEFLFKENNHLNEKLEKLKKNVDEKNNQISLLNFQASEIDSVNPKENEDITLDEQYKRLSHLKEIIQTINQTNHILFEKEEAVFSQIDYLRNLVSSIEKYDSELSKVTKLLDNSIIQIQEVQSELFDQLSKLELKPEELQVVEDRLSSIETLKRKYGGSLNSVKEKRAYIQKELKINKNPEKEQAVLIEKIKKVKEKFTNISIEVHKKRKEMASVLSLKIQNSMKNLNMPGSHFEIKIINKAQKNGFVKIINTCYEHNSKGIDNVEFYLSANPGEPTKPLSLIASGGEISRIMLAIKTVFEKLDPVETLVFDEIDSGISGNAAEKVASHLLELSKSKQVMCITHLSQIAIKADNHLHIVKHVEKDNTSVDYIYAEGNDREKIMNELFLGKKLRI